MCGEYNVALYFDNLFLAIMSNFFGMTTWRKNRVILNQDYKPSIMNEDRKHFICRCFIALDEDINKSVLFKISKSLTSFYAQHIGIEMEIVLQCRSKIRGEWGITGYVRLKVFYFARRVMRRCLYKVCH